MQRLQSRNIAADIEIVPGDELVRMQSERVIRDPAVARKKLFVSTHAQATLTGDELQSVLSVYLAWRHFEAPRLPRHERATFAIELERGGAAHVSEDAKSLTIRYVE